MTACDERRVVCDMTAVEMIAIALRASLELMVLGVGLGAKPEDVTWLLRRPRLFVDSFIAMSVVLPALAIVLTSIFPLHSAVRIAVICLAISPVPPFLPARAMKAHGDAHYMVSLLAVMSLLAIVVIPATVALLSALRGAQFGVSAARIGRITSIGILLPLVAGVLLRRFAPRFADSIARPAAVIGIAVLVLACIPILFLAWREIGQLIGNGTVVVIVVLAALGLAVGHYLGGPEPDDRTVLALATATRHPGIAIAVASTAMPEPKLAAAAVVLSVIVSAIATTPYVRRRRNASVENPHDEHTERRTAA